MPELSDEELQKLIEEHGDGPPKYEDHPTKEADDGSEES